MNFYPWFRSRQRADLSEKSVETVLSLAREGATVPFMARYRKEATGNLDEVQIAEILDSKSRFDELVKRKTFVRSEIEKLGGLSDAVSQMIETCWDLDRIEEIYAPFKQKKKTKAQLAREAGFESLSKFLTDEGLGISPADLLARADALKNDRFKSADDVLEACQDLWIERVGLDESLREKLRQELWAKGVMTSARGTKPEPHSKYENYFEYQEPLKSLKETKNSHRYLAIRRGWMAEELQLKIQLPSEDGVLLAFEAALNLPRAGEALKARLSKAARLSFKGVVWPSLENEIHRDLKDVADRAAIGVFAHNVKTVLMGSPLGAKAVLGVDPGVRTGCKAALVESSGKHLMNFVFFPDKAGERESLSKMIQELHGRMPLSAIAVGNGTAGRETEIFLRALVKELRLDVPVVSVSESGASVYSASEIAREEFPDLDVTVRGAISIARRLQDPLAELVKVDPKSLGVGQYQHDVNAAQLRKSLEQVVEHCVHAVGVNLNTASAHLLAKVSGLGPGLAKALVERREKTGLFKSRTELLEVPRLTQKVFELSAGFLRIPDGIHPLDNTAVHPERYELLTTWAQSKGLRVSDLLGAGVDRLREDKSWAEKVGEFTARDITEELSKPGRDPRSSFVPFAFRDDIQKLEDLKEGMICPGLVTNVASFGAFVDIGVHQDGLVHLSELADRFVKDPLELVRPGQAVTVRVLGVNKEKKQISLSCRLEDKPRQAPLEKRVYEPSAGRNRPEARPRPQEPRRSSGPSPTTPSPRPHRDPGGISSTAPQPGRGAPDTGRGGPNSGRGAPQPSRSAFRNNPFAELEALKQLSKKS